MPSLFVFMDFIAELDNRTFVISVPSVYNKGMVVVNMQDNTLIRTTYNQLLVASMKKGIWYLVDASMGC